MRNKGSQGMKLLKQIREKIRAVTGEKRSIYYLLQSISVSIQRSNAVCVMCTAPACTVLEGIFYFILHNKEEEISKS